MKQAQRKRSGAHNIGRVVERSRSQRLGIEGRWE